MDNINNTKKIKKHGVILQLEEEFYKLSKNNADKTQRPFTQYVIDAIIEHNKKHN